MKTCCQKSKFSTLSSERRVSVIVKMISCCSSARWCQRCLSSGSTGGERSTLIIHEAKLRWKQGGVLTFAVTRCLTALQGGAKQQENSHYFSAAGSTAKWYSTVVPW